MEIDNKLEKVENYTIKSSGSYDPDYLMGFLNDSVKAIELLKPADRNIVKEIGESLSKTKELPFVWREQQQHFLENFGEGRLLEYLIYRYKFERYPELHAASDFPLHVLIEPTSVCNLRCVMCFQIDKTFTRKPYMGIMDVDFYKDIIDALVLGGTKALTLASRGEPTIHPELSSMLTYAKDKFLEFKVNTNATRLTDDLIRSLIESNVNEVVFSVDSSTKELYDQLRPTLNRSSAFQKVVDNIKRFKYIRDNEYSGCITKTRISGVVFHKEQILEDIVKFWEQYVDDVVFVPAENRWDTYNNEVNSIKEPCHYLFERIYLWFDGTINPCDADYKSKLSPGKLSIGEVSVDAISEIWNSVNLSRIRRDHLDGKRSEHHPCDRCEFV